MQNVFKNVNGLAKNANGLAANAHGLVKNAQCGQKRKRSKMQTLAKHDRFGKNKTISGQ